MMSKKIPTRRTDMAKSSYRILEVDAQGGRARDRAPARHLPAGDEEARVSRPDTKPDNTLPAPARPELAARLVTLATLPGTKPGEPSCDDFAVALEDA
jgi:hypothetical protein